MNVGKPRMVGNHGKALGGELGCRTSGLLNVLGWFRPFTRSDGGRERIL